MPRIKWIPPNRPFRAEHVEVAASTLRRAIADGRVTPLGGRVYIASHAWPDDPKYQLGLEALAMQMRRPRYVSSHTAAAVITDLPVLYRPRFETRPGNHLTEFIEALDSRRRSRKSPTVHLRDLPADHIATISSGVLEGLRVTRPFRTALDLACRCALPEALMLTDHVARTAVSHLPTSALRGVLDPDVAGLSLASLENARLSRCHHTHHVRRVLELTDPRRESPGESNSFGHMVLARLPLPECQAAIETDQGIVYPDFWWAKYRLAGECDGRVKYDLDAGAQRTTLLAESERQHRLFRLGIHVVRWRAGDMMYRPAQVLTRLRRRLLDLGWDGRSTDA